MKTFPCRSVVPITVNAYVRCLADGAAAAAGAAAAGAAEAPASATAAPVAAEAPMNVLRSNPMSLSPGQACVSTASKRVDNARRF
ncbi:hypothetical protein GCM10010302_14700 [Streptomyces polychromogenes]|uniref:Secreted protein n=1 Tax=Streptomyces polychromogenes TaxID=67342 RepID=A0ABN0V7I6_9ACTN